MPPIADTAKQSLTKPFTFQGIVFDGTSGDNQTATCPFCDRVGKFCVDPKDGMWTCHPCGIKGNIKSFLKKLYEESTKVTCDYKELRDRWGLLFSSTLQEWGLCRSLITNEWMLPGYKIDTTSNKLNVAQLYLYRPDVVTKKYRFICQSWVNSDDEVKTSHALFCNRWDSKKEEVVIVEGLSDGACLSEILPRTKRNDDDSYSSIGSATASLFANANIVATPGANVFFESWVPLFSGKKVTILYDNDYSRTHPKTGTVTQGAGILGCKKITEVLVASHNRPESIAYLHWGYDGFDPEFANRYDLRDHLSSGLKSLSMRSTLLGELLDKVRPIPDDWVAGKESGSKSLAPSIIRCESWAELQSVWKEAMFWNEGLDAALPAMIATAASVKIKDDLLWLKVISPASTGKTELAEAIATLEEATVIISTFTGLHSGMRLEDGEDASLISILKDKCFIIKEGDTLLRIPDRERVWAELRDAYDCNTRTKFKNGVSNTYLNHPFSHILCGTASLHEMDDSELGQRYLHIVIMKRIDPTVESHINQHRSRGFFAMFGTDPSINGTGVISPVKMRARQMTAGYLQYLRANMVSLAAGISFPEESHEVCDSFAKFIAYFRARPSKKQAEETCRELSTRLCIQISKLAAMLCITLNKMSMDSEIVSRIRKVAIDTAGGITLDIANVLFKYGIDGLPMDVICASVMQGNTEVRTLLQFLEKIEVVEKYKKEGKVGLGTSIRWRLTKVVLDLYAKVVK